MRQLGIALLCSLAACEPAPTPIELVNEQIQLHAMLVAGDSIAAVLLTRAKPTDVFEALISHPVTGAQVTLSDGSTTFTLSPETRSINRCVTYNLQSAFGLTSSYDSSRNATLRSGCYVGAIVGNVRPGVTYSLAATLPGEGTVHGRTTVPEAPLIRSPLKGATLPLRSNRNPSTQVVSVAWTMPANAEHTEIALTLLRTECRGGLASTNEDFGSTRLVVPHLDSVDVEVRWLNCDPADSAATYDGDLVVTAFDANYADLMLERARRSTNTSKVSFGITGAAGTFAASATSRLRVVITRTPD
jgi:hypothetical protein